MPVIIIIIKFGWYSNKSAKLIFLVSNCYLLSSSMRLAQLVVTMVTCVLAQEVL